MKLTIFVLFLCLISNYTFGQYSNIGEQTINYMDSTRNRPVTVEIWYPTDEIDSTFERKTDLPFILSPTIRDAKIMNKSFPLVVLSHGTGGNRFGLAWLAIELAQQGYMVAAPNHWGNTFDNKIPEKFVQYWERPLDISFLITSLLNDTSFNTFIDEDKIGMAGFSFGGYTTLALAGADIHCELVKNSATTKQGKKDFTIPELGDLRPLINKIDCQNIPATFKDNRIKVFVAMAPALGLGYDTTQTIDTQTIYTQTPILIVGAENDQVAPLTTNALRYVSLLPNAKFIKLEGKVGHYVFLNEGTKELQKEAKKYYRDDKTVSRNSIHENLKNAILPFFDSNLK